MKEATTIRAAAAALAALTAAGTATGQSPWVDPNAILPGGPTAQFGQITLMVNPAIMLPDITAAEILGVVPPSVDAGPTAIALGAAMTGSLADPSLGAPLTTSFQRTVDQVFQAWVENPKGNLSDVQVLYQLDGRTGTAGRLEHEQQASSYIGVTVVPTGPWIVDKDKQWRLIQAGGIFAIDLSTATRAGTYQGTLSVTVNSI